MTTVLDRRTGRGAGGRPVWTWIAAAEVVVAAALVVLDLLIPSVLLVLLAGASVLVRRSGFASLGFHRPAHPWRLAGQVLAIVAAWSVLLVGLVLPVAEHVTGERQDVSAFDDLQGNLGLLVALLAASWLLGALVEETAIRGYLQTRITDVLGTGRVGVVAAVASTSLLFAVLHTEQGAVGVVATFLDAVLLGWLRWHFGTVWAPVLAHGFNNTIGVTAYFLVGPVYGLW